MSDSRRLVIRFEQLTEIPEWVFDRTELEFLCVSDNQLTGVSDRIARLTNLKALDIAHNAIASIPETLGELPALSDYLYLSDNKLTAFPEPVARLANLRYLGLTDNRIAALPETIAGLTSLVELRLYNNGMSSLPESLGELTTAARNPPRQQPAHVASGVRGRSERAENSRLAEQPRCGGSRNDWPPPEPVVSRSSRECADGSAGQHRRSARIYRNWICAGHRWRRCRCRTR